MDIKNIIKDNKNAIVLVDVIVPQENNQQKISIKGTGFIINSDGKFITNAHVYKLIPEGELQYVGASIPGKTDKDNLTNYERFPIKLIKIDEENDLALMQIIGDKKFETVVTIGNSEIVQEGEKVIYIGYPLATEMLAMGFGITMTTNECIISSIKRRGIDGSLHFFLIDTHANNGSSGSPIFSENGEVIGVVSGNISTPIPGPNGQMVRIPANIGICRPAKYIENLLK